MAFVDRSYSVVFINVQYSQVVLVADPLPLEAWADHIWTMVIVWNIGGKIIRTVLCCKCWGDSTGVVICLEQGANDLHMVQLMPLPPHHLSLAPVKSRMVYLSDAGFPRLYWKNRLNGYSVVVVVSCCIVNVSCVHRYEQFLKLTVGLGFL